MRPTRSLRLTAFGLLLGVVASLAHAPARAATPPPAAAFALVELFTSEGCSSCPPADALLARLAADPHVYALSFHVTYWDRLGWRDRFSDEAFTRRQGAYARTFALRSLYTPQMVVDGARQFVGSNRAAAQQAIHDALAHPPTATVSLDATTSGRDVAARVHVADAPTNGMLFVAWADGERASAPDRGENDGAHLRHVNVVRDLERVTLRGGAYDGTVKLTRPEAVAGSVVAWVQLGEAGAIDGAARVAVQ